MYSFQLNHLSSELKKQQQKTAKKQKEEVICLLLGLTIVMVL